MVGVITTSSGDGRIRSRSRGREVDVAETARVDGTVLEAEPHVGSHGEVVVAGAHDVDRCLVGVVVRAIEKVGCLGEDGAVGSVEFRNGNERELVAGTLDIGLVILLVVDEAGMREQVRLVVGVDERCRTEHDVVFTAKELVRREHDVLGDVAGVVMGDGFTDFVEVAFGDRDVTGLDFGVGNREKAVAEVEGGVALGVALTCEGALCDVLTASLHELSENEERGAGFLDSLSDDGVMVAQRNVEVVDRGESFDDIAVESFDITVGDINRCLRNAVALERGELRVAGDFAETALAAQFLDGDEEFQHVGGGTDGELSENRVPLDASVLILLKDIVGDDDFSGIVCHCGERLKLED